MNKPTANKVFQYTRPIYNGRLVPPYIYIYNRANTVIQKREIERERDREIERKRERERNYWGLQDNIT